MAGLPTTPFGSIKSTSFPLLKIKNNKKRYTLDFWHLFSFLWDAIDDLEKFQKKDKTGNQVLRYCVN